MLLAIKALRADQGPSITAVTAALAITHHTAVELVNYAETDGHLTRGGSPPTTAAPGFLARSSVRSAP